MSRTDKVPNELLGFSLTTAEILYRMPDHPRPLQQFIWQDYDIYPRFPRLYEFLEFWENNLEGPLYGVRIAHARLLTPREFRLLRSSNVIN